MRQTVAVSVFILLLFSGYKLTVSSKSSVSESDDVNEILRNTVFTDLEGNDVTLQDFEGKTVLIDIWETWCSPCIRSMPVLQDLMNDYPGKFVVLAVSPGYMDTPEQVREFVADNDYDFEFVFSEQLAHSLGIQSIPHKVYVDPNGNYIKSVTGTQGPDLDYENTKAVIEKYL